MQVKHTGPRRHLQLPMEAEEYPGTLDKLRFFSLLLTIDLGIRFSFYKPIYLNKALEVNRISNIQADPYEKKRNPLRIAGQRRGNEKPGPSDDRKARSLLTTAVKARACHYQLPVSAGG